MCHVYPIAGCLMPEADATLDRAADLIITHTQGRNPGAGLSSASDS